MYSLVYVDDDQEDLEIAQLAFEGIGWINHVLFLDSGKKLLNYLNCLQHPLEYPSLLLLDYHLGGMNAEDILIFLRSNPHYKNLRVVVLTTGLPLSSKDRLYHLGAVCCVEKPDSLEKQTELAKGLKRISGEIDSGIEPSFELLDKKNINS